MRPLVLRRTQRPTTSWVVVVGMLVTILHSLGTTRTTTTTTIQRKHQGIGVAAWVLSPITSTRSITRQQRRGEHEICSSRPLRVRSFPVLPRFSGTKQFFRPRSTATAIQTNTALRTTTTTTSHSTSSSSSSPVSGDDHKNSPVLCVGRVWLENWVVEALNDLYHPHDVARGRAQQQWKKLAKKQASTNQSLSNTNDDSATVLDEAAFVEQAVAAAPSQFTAADAAVTLATRAEFGDYQINAALQLASALQANPRTVAQELMDRLQQRLENSTHDTTPPPVTLTLAGPGFLNVAWTETYLGRAVRDMARDPVRLGVPHAPLRQKIVVDFSSPNIAKEMHVGHLRSTILGDTLCNVLVFVGHETVRLNHVGDWGTQFGMLVEHLRDACPEALEYSSDSDNDKNGVDLGDLVQLYKAAKKRFDADADFQTRARQTVVALQSGEPTAVAAWKTLCQASRVEYQQIYDRLNIQNLHERGESFYNPFLNNVIADLEQQNLAVESDGATVVFLDGYTNRDGSPLPMLVRKSDGGFNYATTDLAAIRHRCEFSDGERADRVLYVTDAGQAMHFDMVFETARKAGFVPPTTSLEHVPFGLVQGADGKKFATRSGDTVKLKDLLDEAVRIAGQDLRERYRDSASDAEFLNRVDRVAAIVGIGAVKYADLSMNRESNYRFSYERMLSLNGNTAPYMLYAYARICSIVRKAVGQRSDNDSAIEWPTAAEEIIVSHDSERELLRSLVKLPDVIREVELDLYPNRLCDYLFETSQKFNQFYENCSVMNADTPELKASRLSLCTATAGTLRLLLTLLGIQVVEKL